MKAKAKAKAGQEVDARARRAVGWISFYPISLTLMGCNVTK